MAIASSLARLVCLAGLALVALSAALPALAQDSCSRYRAELARLDRSAGGGGEAREAQQLTAYYRSIGCEGGQFLFFDTRPAQCAGIAQRINVLASAARSEVDVSAQRRHLRAAIAQSCDGARETVRGEQTARGGGQVICVRTCDGGFFPMNNLPDGREGADTMCQALCPGTEAVAYSMPSGDNGLEQAAAIRNRRAYTSLPNAFKFRTTASESCSCRKQGQSWAQSLGKAEQMLDRHKDDLIVTAARAEEMSRPRVAAAKAGKKSVPVAGTAIASSARPVTPATASLAAKQTTAGSAGATPPGATAADLDARVETTGTVAPKPAPAAQAVRIIPTPPAPPRPVR